MRQVIKKLAGLWNVVPEGKTSPVQFKSMSRKTAAEFAAQWNAAMESGHVADQFNVSLGHNVWSKKP